MHVVRKETIDWVEKYAEYEVEGSRPKTTRREVVQKDCRGRKLNREDDMDRSRWRKVIKIGW